MFVCAVWISFGEPILTITIATSMHITISTYSAYKSLHTSSFFHILLCCSLMLNCFELIFLHINLHSIHHNDRAKTEFSQLCKLIQNKKLK